MNGFEQPAESLCLWQAIVTVYRPRSHADLRVGRLTEGYYRDGRKQPPRVHLVSMYTDQVPENDMSRAMSAKHGFKILPTVREALTMGGSGLAVDGVLLIGEHGDYPSNEKGQKLYPRYELYKQIIDVFKETGRAVPIYCDKHLSVEWWKAKWMYDQHRELGFPLMAGSSVPLTWRTPPLELELETPIEKAVVAADGPKESYGFHALEGLQCMVERRTGGETGIAAVQCLEGPDVWRWTDRKPWAERLLGTALDHAASRRQGSVRDNVKEPILFSLEYRSGLEAAVYMLNGHLEGRVFAAEIKGREEPVHTEFWNQPGRPWGHSLGEFYHAEQMILTGRTAYPVERALLTTGALEALMDSSYRGNRRLETSHLSVAYRAQKESLFSRGPRPPLEEARP